jgi:GTP 3',8-cyclase
MARSEHTPFSQSDRDMYSSDAARGSDAEMAAFIERTAQQKEARHHIGEFAFLKPSRSMVHIGG